MKLKVYSEVPIDLVILKNSSGEIFNLCDFFSFAEPVDLLSGPSSAVILSKNAVLASAKA
jgi:hypothetical protein